MLAVPDSEASFEAAKNDSAPFVVRRHGRRNPLPSSRKTLPYPHAALVTHNLRCYPFRSLCKAAAISSVVQLFVQAARRLSKVGRWGSYLMEWVRNIMDYVLTYAICFISIYGLSFSEVNLRSRLFSVRE